MMESKCVFRMLAVVCGAAVLMLSCSENEQETARTLEDVASFIEERPDSAMAILDTMGRERLKTKSLRARHSLLLAMARDKNWIDDMTDSVIAPAVSWYRRHGSADERLLMNYYRGRIAMNAGDYEAAMEWFVKAERCGKSSHDMMCLGRLHGAKSAVYNHLFDSESVIREERKAGECFLAAGDSAGYFDSVINVATECNEIQDTSVLRTCLDVLYDNFNMLSEPQKSSYFAINISAESERHDASVCPMIEEYLSAVSDSSLIHWIIVADAYRSEGKYKDSRRALDAYIKYDDSHELAYQWVNGLVSEALGDYSAAAKSYRKYITEDGNKDIDIFESDTKFIEERAASERKISNQKYTIIIAFLLFVIAVLVVGFITERLIRSRKDRDMEQEKHRMEMELAEAEKIRLENEKLNYERLHREALDRIALLERIRKEARLDKNVREAVEQLLGVLNKFFMAHVSETFNDVASAELAALMDDQKNFFRLLSNAFKVSHKNFIRYLKKSRLSEWEVGCCCLFCIGLNNKEIKHYLKRPSFNNDVSKIRVKLKVEKGSIYTFLCKRMAEMD